MEITSVNNQLIKDMAKLHQKKYRDELSLFLIEGYHLYEEALRINYDKLDLNLLFKSYLYTALKNKTLLMLVRNPVFRVLAQLMVTKKKRSLVNLPIYILLKTYIT